MNIGNLISIQAVKVDQSAIKGEAGTGYEAPAGKGLFACSNCNYFSAGLCSQPIMMRVSKLPRNGAGKVLVDSAGCCEYVERAGRR